MEYQATSKYARVATRKVRLVADSVRKLTPGAALASLSVLPKAAAIPLGKTIASAVSNATAAGVEVGALRFKTIEIMGGPVMKRFHAVSRGQAHSYKKRMTHIRVIVTDQVEAKGKVEEAQK